jgi:hypothetical protein
VWRSRLVGSDGAIGEALRALVRWVEDDVAPPPTTADRFTGDSRLVLADSAPARGGVQPVVRLEVNGAARAAVSVGETVNFVADADQPPGVGTIVSATWDFEGMGNFFDQPVDAALTSIKLEAAHSYDAPGTYFPSFRIGAHRDGVEGGGFPIENCARVRVVVSD